MKVISFNANGIRAATRKGFFKWFEQQHADFLCVQETKAQFDQLKGNPIYFPQGYNYAYTDAKKKGYSGVAIYAKRQPQQIIHRLGLDWADDEGRYIQFDYEDLSIASVYVPSGSSGDERQAYKMDFLDKYKILLQKQFSMNRSFIICGDINIVHKEIDIKNWKQNQKTSGVLLEERSWLDYIFDDIGWIDAFRTINKNSEQYTWWSNRGQARLRNVGWRIDYQLISPKLKCQVLAENVYINEFFSDHAPLTIIYQD